MRESSERFECRTLPETFPWFCDFAQKHGYTNGNNTPYYRAKNPIKGSVSRLLTAIKDGEFLLAKSVTVAIVNKTSADRTAFFRCRLKPGTLEWLQDAAYYFGYIYSGQGAVNRLLEAIMLGEISITKVED